MKHFVHLPGQRRSVALGDRGVRVGDGEFLVIGGPCAVESRDGMQRIAEGVASGGGALLRGGAWKPRTSPRSFQGMGMDAIAPLVDAGAHVGLPVVTEVLDPRDVERVAPHVDVLQIGARNMSNSVLLREVARTGRPILLKRGFGATVAELLDAAEYVLGEGNEDILLVERGIRTFETSTRFTLDLAAVPVLRERTHLPILVDPSHAAGAARWVPDLARAAAAVGADGIMVEVHDNPDLAMSDADQALRLDEFVTLVDSLDPLLDALGQRRSRPTHAIDSVIASPATA